MRRRVMRKLHPLLQKARLETLHYCTKTETELSKQMDYPAEIVEALGLVKRRC